MKKLFVEKVSMIEMDKGSIQESISKNDGRLIIRNVLLQRADTPNKNRRVYPRSILEKELNNYFKKIDEKRAFGELDHPMGDDGNVVSLKNVCQVIKDARWKGNEVIGDIEVLKTPSGNIIKEILLAGYRIGQSSRGLGSVQPLKEGDDDVVEVQDDFELLTLADCVSDESTHNANMIIGEGYNRKITYENKVDELIREIICEISGVCPLC